MIKHLTFFVLCPTTLATRGDFIFHTRKWCSLSLRKIKFHEWNEICEFVCVCVRFIHSQSCASGWVEYQSRWGWCLSHSNINDNTCHLNMSEQARKTERDRQTSVRLKKKNQREKKIVFLLRFSGLTHTWRFSRRGQRMISDSRLGLRLILWI